MIGWLGESGKAAFSVEKFFRRSVDAAKMF
jgi:hypothetical protein